MHDLEGIVSLLFSGFLSFDYIYYGFDGRGDRDLLVVKELVFLC